MADITVMNNVQGTNKKMGLVSLMKSAVAHKVARLKATVTCKAAKTLYKYVAMPMLIWMASRGFAQAEDLLASGKTDAEESFGESSTFMYLIMLAEVAVVFLAFLKTHNPAILLLIPVFIVATKIIFTMLNSRFATP